MSRPDWMDTPYVRVYLTMIEDHPSVWDDDPLLAWWLRLLVQADRYHPAPAPLPGIPAEILTTLVAEGCIEPVPTGTALVSRYRFRGLAGQRTASSDYHRKGGQARAASAPRDAGGRMLANAGDLNGKASANAGAAAGPAMLESSIRDQDYQQHNTTPTSSAGDASLRSASPAPSRTIAPAPARVGATVAGASPTPIEVCPVCKARGVVDGWGRVIAHPPMDAIPGSKGAEEECPGTGRDAAMQVLRG